MVIFDGEREKEIVHFVLLEKRAIGAQVLLFHPDGMRRPPGLRNIIQDFLSELYSESIRSQARWQRLTTTPFSWGREGSPALIGAFKSPGVTCRRTNGRRVLKV